MALSDYTPVISSIKLPGSSEKYYFKDAYAREMIGSIGNVTKFLGITATEIEDGATVSNVTLTDGTVIAAADIKDGNIVISKTGLSDYGTELICATVNNTKYWFACGSTQISNLGELAEYDNVELTGELSVSTSTLSPSSVSVMVTLDGTNPYSTYPLSDFMLLNSEGFYQIGGTIDEEEGKTFDTPTLRFTNPAQIGRVELSSNFATYGKIKGIEAVCSLDPNVTSSAVGNTAISVVTGISSVSTITSVEVTVPSMSIYGFSASDSSFMTGPESIVKTGNLVSAIAGTSSVAEKIKEYTFAMDSVDTETLVITSASVGVTIAEVLSSTTTLSTGTSNTATTVSVATPGAIASSLITQPTFSVTPITNIYGFKLSNPDLVAASEITFESTPVIFASESLPVIPDDGLGAYFDYGYSLYALITESLYTPSAVYVDALSSSATVVTNVSLGSVSTSRTKNS